MKVLIFSDIHLRHSYVDTMVEWEYPCDQIICMGDIFDAWGDDARMVHDAALWYKAKLHNLRWVFCFGNHDVSYRWPDNPYAQCSGFTEAKEMAIRSVMTEQDWLKVRPYYAIPEWGLFFSHAGFDRHLPTLLASKGFPAPPANPSLQQLTDYLDSEWPHVVARFSTQDSHHPLLGIGRARGGDQTIGAITWHDYREHTPMPGLGQIMGHTIGDIPLFRFHQGPHSKAPMWRRADKGPLKTHWFEGGWSLDLDTSSKHYAILDTATGILTIRQVHWHRHYREGGHAMGGGFDITQGPIIATIQLPRPGAAQSRLDNALNPS